MPQTYARLSDRHPFEVYLLVWTLVSVTPSALGITPMPVNLRTAGEATAHIWAVATAFGSLVALVGLWWPRPGPGKLSVSALICEQVGLVVVAVSMLYYSAWALFRTGFNSIAIIGIILGFGLASAVQAWKIQRLLKKLHEQ